jgi:outer membrane protein assembly factor BamA
VLDINPGQKVNRSMLTERIELLYGKAWFDKVKYRIIPRNDSLILVIDCIEKPQAMLYGAVHYDNSLQSGLIFEISIKNMLTQRSMINFRSRIGQYFRLDLSYLQFIDKNQVYGLSANVFSDNTLIPMLELRGDRGDVISRNFTPELTVNRRIGLNNMMSISECFENSNLSLRYLSDFSLKNLSFNYLTTDFNYQINSLDNKHFPHRGTKLNFSASTSRLLSATIRTDTSRSVLRWSRYSLFSPERFYTFHGTIDYFFSPAGKTTFSLGGDILFTTGTDSISRQNNFHLLGGFESLNMRSIPMIGFQSNEIPVYKLAGFRTSIDLEPVESFHLNIMANIFVVQEAYRSKGFSLLSGLGIGAGYMSIIGPIKIGLMYGNYRKESYFHKIKGYISIGYNF